MWSLVLLNPASATAPGQVAELTVAAGRSLTFSNVDAHTLTFTMPGRHRHTAAVVPLVSDVLAYRDSDAIMRFRVVGRTLDWSSGVLTASFSAVSYRALFDARILHDTDTRSWNAATEQSAIAWAMIAASQSKASGALGLSRGMLPDTAVNRTLASATEDGKRSEYFEAGTKISDAVQQIADLDNGFWFDFEPDRATQVTEKTLMKFNVWNLNDRNQHAGHSPLLLTPQSTLLEYTHAVVPPEYANVVRVTGEGTTAENTTGAAQTAAWAPAKTGSPLVSNPVLPAPEGRWERSYGESDLSTQAAVNARAPKRLIDARQYSAEFSGKLARGRWQGRSQLWLGDKARVIVTELVDDTSDSYVIYLDEDMIVSEIGVSVDDEGAEDVSVSLNRPRWTSARASKEISDRVARLERR